MILGYFGDEVLDHLPLTTWVNCYSIDASGKAEFYGAGTLQELQDTDYVFTDDYGFEVVTND